MNAAAPGELVAICCPDLSGLVRGRAVASGAWDRAAVAGVGWVPADQAVTALGPIADGSPWGCTGDLRILPDPAARIRVPAGDRPALHVALGDLVEPDGTPWEGCLRHLLRRAVDRLAAVGLRARVALEHEFQLRGLPGEPAPAFSLRALRRAEPLMTELLAAATAAGLEPETILPEFGRDQVELTVAPTDPLAAADRAVLLREVVRDTALGHGLQATFAPILDPADVGNGVHVHLSLTDLDGTPVTHDASAPTRLAGPAASFAAGLLAHLPALLALSAPTPASYLRLTPHRWSAAFACLGVQNREAAIRVAPTATLDGGDPAGRANLEFRPADATAAPHLLLAALLAAGAAGVAEGLPAPDPVQDDPGDLDADALAARGIRRLPTTLPEALTAFEADPLLAGFLPEPLRTAIIAMRRTELALVDGLSTADLCERYARAH